MLFIGGKINMNIKIIGVLVCILLIATVIPVSGMIKEDNKYTEQSKNSISINIYQPTDEYVYLGGKQAFEIPIFLDNFVMLNLGELGYLCLV